MSSTPLEQIDERRGDNDVAQFEPNQYGIWCPVCGNMIVNDYMMHDEDVVLPECCDECGYPDQEEMADYFVGDDDGS